MIKETPIIMLPESVRAIWDDRKGVTRRVIDPVKYGAPANCKKIAPYCTGTKEPLAFYWKGSGGCWNSSKPLKSPYGGPGDLLWVRENWWHEKGTDFENAAFEDGTIVQNDGKIFKIPDWKPVSPHWRKRPSIHMFKWAARTWLEIINIRIERLQEITDEDIKAEGIDLFELSLLDNFMGKKPVKNPSNLFWHDGPHGQSDEIFCQKCVEKEVKKLGEEYSVDGGWDSWGEDGPRFCDRCQAMLNITFTDEGTEQEIEHFEKNPVRDAIDVSSIMTAIGSDSDWDGGSPELAKRLRRICFRELWNSINAKRGFPWDSNPAVRRIEFKRVKHD